MTIVTSISIYLSEVHAKLLSGISSRQIDIGLIDTPVPVAGLNATLFSLECVCVMHQDDPLALNKDIIHPTDLAGRSIVSVTSSNG